MSAGEDPSAAPSPSVLTIGTFDGVHLGHQRLIREARADAKALGLPVLAVTFDRNPLEIVRPQLAPRSLTELGQKLELLSATGVDEVVVLAFDQARAEQSAEDFVRIELVGQLGARRILVGANFRFGHRQAGDAGLLAELGAKYGFSSRAVGLVTDDETHGVVSSTRIRSLVQAGALEEAAHLLGRPHEVRGMLHRSPEGPVLEIAASLVLPPPGRYRALLDPAGAQSEVFVLVRLEGGPSQLLELQEAVRPAGGLAESLLDSGRPVALSLLQRATP